MEEQRSALSECECVLCLSGFEYNVLEEQGQHRVSVYSVCLGLSTCAGRTKVSIE